MRPSPLLTVQTNTLLALNEAGTAADVETTDRSVWAKVRAGGHFKEQRTEHRAPCASAKAPWGGHTDALPRPLRRHIPTSHTRLLPCAVPLPPNVPRRCRSHETAKTNNRSASTRILPRCRPTSSRGREPRCPGAPTSAAAAASRSPSICSRWTTSRRPPPPRPRGAASPRWTGSGGTALRATAAGSGLTLTRCRWGEGNHRGPWWASRRPWPRPWPGGTAPPSSSSASPRRRCVFYIHTLCTVFF